MSLKDNFAKNSLGKESKHSHSSHLKMMAICCGIPIVGFLVIAGLGINAPSLTTLLFIACPIVMVGMMYMMRNKSDSKGGSCCSSEATEHEETSDKSGSVDQAGSCCSSGSETSENELQNLTVDQAGSCCSSGTESAKNEPQILTDQNPQSCCCSSNTSKTNGNQPAV